MAEIICGEWEGFTFKMIEREDYPQVLEHLRNSFYQDEPICRALNLSQLEMESQDMDTVAVAYMEEKVSFMAIDNATNKLVAVRIFAISENRDGVEELRAALRSRSILSLYARVVELHELADINGQLGVEKYGDFLFVSVDREYRGRGLATEMYNRAIKLLQHFGCPAAMSSFTSPYSQKIARNLGFKELARRPLRQLLHDDGTPIVPGAAEEDVSIVMAKKF